MFLLALIDLHLYIAKKLLSWRRLAHSINPDYHPLVPRRNNIAMNMHA